MSTEYKEGKINVMSFHCNMTVEEVTVEEVTVEEVSGVLLKGQLTMTGPVLARMVMTPMYTADAWALIAGMHTSCTTQRQITTFNTEAICGGN